MGIFEIAATGLFTRMLHDFPWDHLGNISLMLATALAYYGMAVSFLGGQYKKQNWIDSGKRAALMCFFTLSIAAASLIILQMTNQYHIKYVQSHTNNTLSPFFKFAAFWAGMEGSLMMWGWILLAFTAVAMVVHRKQYQEYMPFVVGTCLLTATFFLTTNLTAANPFSSWAEASASVTRVFQPGEILDGEGLNPQLQHWAMVIHPPTLYLGYVGTVVPFAFAFAALWTGKLGNEWLKVIRRWMVVAWLFLSLGILLGAAWAYVELGWGGYWMWDPVENASFMPWLLATAALHSIQVQERRGMLKVWNVVLVIGTYMFCIFGTFLTRSGIINSVHSFAKSAIGTMFLTYLLGIGLLSAIMVIIRLPDLKAQNRLDSLASRESAFLFNNVLFLVSCFSILCGTMFPVISEWVTNNKITVGPPFFNKINIPIYLLLALLMGVGPLMAWRRTSPGVLWQNFGLPGIAGVVVTAATLAWMRDLGHIFVALSFGLATFVVLTILIEFRRGVAARRNNHSENVLASVYALMRRNGRRYGGYIVHFGIILMIIGVSGNAFNEQSFGDLQPGQTLNIKNYSMTLRDVRTEKLKNYDAMYVDLDLKIGDKDKGIITPYQRVYHSAKEMPNSEVYIRSTPKEDLYVNFAGTTASGAVSIRAYVKPLVQWIWIGGIVLLAGALIALLGTPKSAPAGRRISPMGEAAEA